MLLTSLGKHISPELITSDFSQEEEAPKLPNLLFMSRLDTSNFSQMNRWYSQGTSEAEIFNH